MTTLEILQTIILNCDAAWYPHWDKFHSWAEPTRHADENVWEFEKRIGRIVRDAALSQLAARIDREQL